MTASGRLSSVTGSVFLVAVLLSGSARADVFTIHNKRINVPAPAGFTPVTEDMPAIAPLVELAGDPLNDTLAFYIPEALVPFVMMGDVRSLDRWFVLKANKSLRTVTVGRSEFYRFKETLRDQNRDVIQGIRSSLSDLERTRSQRLSQELGHAILLETAQLVPLDPHFEDGNTIAYSMYLKQDMSTDSTQSTDITAATNTTLNAAGTILFLYSYGDQDDLEWTRNASKNWASTVIASNTQPPSTSPGRRTGFDWKRIVLSGMFWGPVSGLAALVFRRFFSVRKDQRPS